MRDVERLASHRDQQQTSQLAFAVRRQLRLAQRLLAQFVRAELEHVQRTVAGVAGLCTACSRRRRAASAQCLRLAPRRGYHLPQTRFLQQLRLDLALDFAVRRRVEEKFSARLQLRERALHEAALIVHLLQPALELLQHTNRTVVAQRHAGAPPCHRVAVHHRRQVVAPLGELEQPPDGAQLLVHGCGRKTCPPPIPNPSGSMLLMRGRLSLRLVSPVAGCGSTTKLA